MLSDSGEVPVDGGDKTSTENSKKRKLKTPIQIMALENFFNEHKYPTEEMKAKLAVEIGLTEKQVSGWFCHRRLKDKRSVKEDGNTIGSQDRSSVVLQDRGSGLRQDSCGSTKQTDYLTPKPLREVESQRLYGGGSYTGNANGEEEEEEEDTTSSERSSSKNNLVSSKDGVRDLESSRYVVARSNDVHPQVSRSSYGYNNNNNKPSGYLKVKGEIENLAITAVKRQLGRQYREDGPPLGVEFDPLPPKAFEPQPQTNAIVQEPIYVGNRRSYSPYISGTTKKSFNPPGPSYELARKSKMPAPDPYSEDDDDDDDRLMVGMEPGLIRDKTSLQEPRLKSPSLGFSNPVPSKGVPREIPLTNSKQSRIISNSRPEGSRNNLIANNFHNQTHDYDKNVFNGGRKSGYLTKSLPLSSNRSPDSMERGPSSMMAGKYHGERNHMKMHREKLHLTDEPPVTKRVKHGYHLQQIYAPKSSHGEINRSSGVELNSSFSGDETGETSSSSMD